MRVKGEMFIGVRVWRETWIGEERNQYKERHRKEKETKITDAKTKENEIEVGFQKKEEKWKEDQVVAAIQWLMHFNKILLNIVNI